MQDHLNNLSDIENLYERLIKKSTKGKITCEEQIAKLVDFQTATKKVQDLDQNCFRGVDALILIMKSENESASKYIKQAEESKRQMIVKYFDMRLFGIVLCQEFKDFAVKYEFAPLEIQLNRERRITEHLGFLSRIGKLFQNDIKQLQETQQPMISRKEHLEFHRILLIAINRRLSDADIRKIDAELRVVADKIQRLQNKIDGFNNMIRKSRTLYSNLFICPSDKPELFQQFGITLPIQEDSSIIRPLEISSSEQSSSAANKSLIEPENPINHLEASFAIKDAHLERCQKQLDKQKSLRDDITKFKTEYNSIVAKMLKELEAVHLKWGDAENQLQSINEQLNVEHGNLSIDVNRYVAQNMNEQDMNEDTLQLIGHVSQPTNQIVLQPEQEVDEPMPVLAPEAQVEEQEFDETMPVLESEEPSGATRMDEQELNEDTLQLIGHVSQPTNQIVLQPEQTVDETMPVLAPEAQVEEQDLDEPMPVLESEEPSGATRMDEQELNEDTLKFIGHVSQPINQIVLQPEQEVDEPMTIVVDQPVPEAEEQVDEEEFINVVDIDDETLPASEEPSGTTKMDEQELNKDTLKFIGHVSQPINQIVLQPEQEVDEPMPVLAPEAQVEEQEFDETMPVLESEEPSGATRMDEQEVSEDTLQFIGHVSQPITQNVLQPEQEVDEPMPIVDDQPVQEPEEQVDDEEFINVVDIDDETLPASEEQEDVPVSQIEDLKILIEKERTLKENIAREIDLYEKNFTDDNSEETEVNYEIISRKVDMVIDEIVLEKSIYAEKYFKTKDRDDFVFNVEADLQAYLAELIGEKQTPRSELPQPISNECYQSITSQQAASPDSQQEQDGGDLMLVDKDQQALEPEEQVDVEQLIGFENVNAVVHDEDQPLSLSPQVEDVPVSETKDILLEKVNEQNETEVGDEETIESDLDMLGEQLTNDNSEKAEVHDDTISSTEMDLEVSNDIVKKRSILPEYREVSMKDEDRLALLSNWIGKKTSRNGSSEPLSNEFDQSTPSLQTVSEEQMINHVSPSTIQVESQQDQAVVEPAEQVNNVVDQVIGGENVNEVEHDEDQPVPVSPQLEDDQLSQTKNTLLEEENELKRTEAEIEDTIYGVLDTIEKQFSEDNSEKAEVHDDTISSTEMVLDVSNENVDTSNNGAAKYYSPKDRERNVLQMENARPLKRHSTDQSASASSESKKSRNHRQALSTIKEAHLKRRQRHLYKQTRLLDCITELQTKQMFLKQIPLMNMGTDFKFNAQKLAQTQIELKASYKQLRVEVENVKLEINQYAAQYMDDKELKELVVELIEQISQPITQFVFELAQEVDEPMPVLEKKEPSQARKPVIRRGQKPSVSKEQKDVRELRRSTRMKTRRQAEVNEKFSDDDNKASQSASSGRYQLRPRASRSK